MAVAVPAAELGGTLTVQVLNSSDFSDLAMLKIPVA